jgi:hypothetical protein
MNNQYSHEHTNGENFTMKDTEFHGEKTKII